jgi:hypothetical protein
MRVREGGTEEAAGSGSGSDGEGEKSQQTGGTEEAAAADDVDDGGGRRRPARQESMRRATHQTPANPSLSPNLITHRQMPAHVRRPLDSCITPTGNPTLHSTHTEILT